MPIFLSTYTRAHVCMFTPRLLNKNKKNTYEQMNAKQNMYSGLHTYTYKMEIKQ